MMAIFTKQEDLANKLKRIFHVLNHLNSIRVGESCQHLNGISRAPTAA